MADWTEHLSDKEMRTWEQIKAIGQKSEVAAKPGKRPKEDKPIEEKPSSSYQGRQKTKLGASTAVID